MSEDLEILNYKENFFIQNEQFIIKLKNLTNS